MRLRVPHPRRAAQQRRAVERERIEQAVRRARLRARTPQSGVDPLAEDRQRQQDRRWTR